jgi:hypothetical protein
MRKAGNAPVSAIFGHALSAEKALEKAAQNEG